MYRNVILLAFVVLLQSCSSLNNNLKSTFEEDSITYLYVSDLDISITSKITLFSSGDFVYSETNHYFLGELCQNNKGIWHQKKDTIYLTTFFQNEIDDYIVELGDIRYKDSVLIHVYSQQTEKPTDDFAFLNENDSLILPTTEGTLCVPCTEKARLIRQLLLGITDDNKTPVSLECGKEYKYYIKDCIPTVMHEEKFIATDSCLLEISTGKSYRRESGRK